MNFEELMKIIEDEVNKIDYNSEIILTNTKTGKKLIIPKNETKPTNFFNIPYDIREIIYRNVRYLKDQDKYILIDNDYLQAGSLKMIYILKKKQNEIINFIDSDDEDDDISIIYNKAIEKLMKYKNRILEPRIIDRNLKEIYVNKTTKRIEIDYTFIFDKRNIDIDQIFKDNFIKIEYDYIRQSYNYLDVYRENIDNKKIRFLSNIEIIKYDEIFRLRYGEIDEFKILIEKFNERKDEIWMETEIRDKHKKLDDCRTYFNDKFKELYFSYVAKRRKY